MTRCIIILLAFQVFEVNSQYELRYELMTSWMNSPLEMIEIWKPDTSWVYTYYGDSYDYRKVSDDGSQISVTKKFNTGYKNLSEYIKIPDKNIVYLMETVMWGKDNVNYSYDYYDNIEYQLIDSIRYIDSLLCKLAICTHRCRDYFLWYTLEIPITSGPWKFHGLPGAIIYVKDMHNEVMMKLVSIKKTSKKINTIFDKENIVTEKLPYWNIQKEDYDKFITNIQRKINDCKGCPSKYKSKLGPIKVLECFE